MRFITRQDVEAPKDFVFGAVSAFPMIERLAARRGVEIVRTDSPGRPQVGSTWHIVFAFRGRSRKINARLVAFDPPEGYAFEGISDGLGLHLGVALEAVSETVTRMTVTIELRPTTVTSRFLVQSLKVARTAIARRLDVQADGFARTIEERYEAIA